MGYDLNGLKKAGFLLVIVKIEMEYKKPAYANDELEVNVGWIERGKTSAAFEQEIHNCKTNELIARAKIIWVSTDLKGKPIAIPDVLIESYQKTFGNLFPKSDKCKWWIANLRSPSHRLTTSLGADGDFAPRRRPTLNLDSAICD